MKPHKFHIDRQEFISAMTSAASALPSRTSLPIISTVRLLAEADAIGLTVNNLDSCITVTRPAEIMAPGAFCLPAKRLLDTAKALQSEKLFFDGGKSRVSVSDGNGSRIDLPFLPAEEFPPAPSVEEPLGMDFEKGVFSTMLKTVAPFASEEQTRYNLLSVMLHGDGQTLAFVATCGRMMRIHRMAAPLKCWTTIPIAAARLMAALSADEAVRLSIGESSASVHGVNWRFQTKLIETTTDPVFYQQVIPREEGYDQVIDINRGVLLACINAACVVGQDFPQIKLSKVGKGKLQITASDPQTGDSEICVPDSQCTLKEEIILNPIFLTTTLRSFTEERLVIKVKNPMEPVTIKDDRGLAIITPLRIA